MLAWSMDNGFNRYVVWNYTELFTMFQDEPLGQDLKEIA